LDTEGLVSKLTPPPGLRIALLTAIVAMIGCDRATKQMAAIALAGTPRLSFLADTVRIEYAENPGGFLSAGAHLPPAARTGLFVVGNGLALVLVVAVAIRRRWKGWPLAGLCLFIAGGASNWIDRAAHGSVIDFINVGVGPLRTGIFNIADVAIMLGIAIVVLTEREWRRNGEARV
jgi:signal peptidase II